MHVPQQTLGGRARLEMATDDLHRQWCSTRQGHANQTRREKEETKEQISKAKIGQKSESARRRERKGRKNFLIVVQEKSDNRNNRFRKGCLP